jgi:hypothetical protein
LFIAKLNQDNKYDEQIRKIKLEYELKIRTLHTDLAKYEQIKAKNTQMLKNALETEKQLEQLRKEIVDMKKLKVKLMNQLKEESQKSKQEEQKRQREIALLKRDHLKKDNQIKSLEAEKKCREIVLKRKQEQIQALRKHNNGTRGVLSEKASGRTAQTLNNMLNEANELIAITSSKYAHNVSRNGQKNTTGSDQPTTYLNKRKMTYQHKWQKFDETVITQNLL